MSAHTYRIRTLYILAMTWTLAIRLFLKTNLKNEDWKLIDLRVDQSSILI